ncbi:MAG: FecR family protein [Candidatus Bilamarchaeaceae archaeon]
MSYVSGNAYTKTPNGILVKVVSEIPLSRNSIIVTGDDSWVAINLSDGSKVYLDEETEIKVNELERKQLTNLEVVLELIKGALFSDVTKRENTKWEVKSGGNAIGIKGTKFSVYYDDVKKETTVKALEGVVTVSDSFDRTIELSDGQMVVSSDSTGLGSVQDFDSNAEIQKWSGRGSS